MLSDQTRVVHIVRADGAIIPTPRGADGGFVMPPEPSPAPRRTIPAQVPSFLAGTHTRLDRRGHHTAAGLPGEHAAGLLDVVDMDRLPPAPAEGELQGPDALVAELTVAMQAYASIAPIVRYSELIPFLARTLVENGWVEE